MAANQIDRQRVIALRQSADFLVPGDNFDVLGISPRIIEDKDMNKEIYELFELFDTDKNKVINKDDFEVGFKHLETDLS